MKTGVCKLRMADYLTAPAFSQSTLKLVAKSPAHFRYAIEHPEPSTEAQIIGEVCHTAILEPHLLQDSCYLRPETYASKSGEKKWHGGADACKTWLAEHSDKPVITVEDMKRVQGMHQSVFAHPSAAAALKEGAAEMTFFVDDPVTGIPLKARPDWISGNTLINLKTTEDASEEAFSKTIAYYGYDAAAAFYLDMSKWVGVPKDFYLFIAVEKEMPYAVAVYELDHESIEIGRNKYRRWLSIIDHCRKTDEWPGYDTGIKSISLPSWHKRQQQLTLGDGYFPTDFVVERSQFSHSQLLSGAGPGSTPAGLVASS